MIGQPLYNFFSNIIANVSADYTDNYNGTTIIFVEGSFTYCSNYLKNYRGEYPIIQLIHDANTPNYTNSSTELKSNYINVNCKLLFSVGTKLTYTNVERNLYSFTNQLDVILMLFEKYLKQSGIFNNNNIVYQYNKQYLPQFKGGHVYNCPVDSIFIENLELIMPINYGECFTPDRIIQVLNVIVTPESYSLQVDETLQLTATLSPENASNKAVTWISSNENIATVDENGLVTSITSGNVIITATCNDGGGFYGSCIIAIVVYVQSVTLDEHALTLNSNDTYTIGYEVLPINATNKNVTWLSSDESKATVDSNGLITCLSVGEVIITITTVDGSYTDNCVLTIEQAVIHVTSVVIDHDVLILSENETGQLTATVYPLDATDKTVHWTSSDESKVLVDYNTGLVTAVDFGSITITVRTVDGNFTDTVNVVVNSIKDIEGNVYPVITIGSQKWIGSNWQCTKYNDGETANFVYPNGNALNKADYGLLYNFMDASNLAPVGWRLPTKEEVEALSTTSNGQDYLKETGTTYWNATNSAINNNLAFSGRGAGNATESGGLYYYNEFKNLLYSWTTSDYNINSKYVLYLKNIANNTNLLNFFGYTNNRFCSVRLIKDNLA